MDRQNKWNEWSDHVAKAIEEGASANKSLKNLFKLTSVLISILILLVAYIWQDEKTDNTKQFEILNSTLNELKTSDKSQDEKITDLEKWRQYYINAKEKGNTRGGAKASNPNQLINNIQYVPDESQVAGRN
jgi:hypothetical protein